MSLFLGYVVAVVGIVVGVGLLLVQHFDPRGFALLRGAALDATAPFSAVGNGIARGVANAGGEIAAYIDAGSKNKALKAEIEIARRKLIAARITDRENRRLRATLRLIDPASPPVATGRLIASDASSPRRLATLSAGWGDGVRPGQPVRSADGLVGQVFESGHFAARVLLLTDGGSTIPVRVVRGGAAAIATGRGDGALELRALVGGGRPFARGDIVVTSGAGGLFAPDIPVAIVVSATGETALAWPLADPARQDIVIVSRPYQPVPSPAPAPAVAKGGAVTPGADVTPPAP